MSNGKKRVPSLLETVKIGIGYEHFVRLQAIDLHDFSLVKKKVAQDREGASEGYLDWGVHYLKRYYALQVLDPLNPPAMSRPIDPFWHVHTLFTHQYIAFCDQVFGEYLHHVPLLFKDKLATAFVAELYMRTVKRHAEVFTDVDFKFIPKSPDDGMCCTPTYGSNPKIISQALFPAEKIFLVKPIDVA